jgi:flagellar motor protein MotB
VARALLEVLAAASAARGCCSAAAGEALVLPCLRALAELQKDGTLQRLEQQGEQEQQQQQQQKGEEHEQLQQQQQQQQQQEEEQHEKQQLRSKEDEQQQEVAKASPAAALQRLSLQHLLQPSSQPVASQAAALLKQLLPQQPARLEALTAQLPAACAAGPCAAEHFFPMLLAAVAAPGFDFAAAGQPLLQQGVGQLLLLAQQLAAAELSDQALLASLAPQGGRCSCPSASASVRQLAALLAALLACPGAVGWLAQRPELLRDLSLALAALQALGAAATPATAAAQQQLLALLSSQVGRRSGAGVLWWRAPPWLHSPLRRGRRSCCPSSAPHARPAHCACTGAALHARGHLEPPLLPRPPGRCSRAATCWWQPTRRQPWTPSPCCTPARRLRPPPAARSARSAAGCAQRRWCSWRARCAQRRRRRAASCSWTSRPRRRTSYGAAWGGRRTAARRCGEVLAGWLVLAGFVLAGLF